MAEPTTELLATTIARHFPEATAEGDQVDVGFRGLRLGCRIGVIRPLGGTLQTVELLFDLRGDDFRASIPLATTGYAPTVEEAIVEGATGWVTAFGPVLRAALTGEYERDVECLELELERSDRPLEAHLDSFDRVLHLEPDGEQAEEARARFGGWLIEKVLGSPRPPVLPTDRACVLSVFVAELSPQRIVEVQLDGVPCPGFEDLVAAVPLPARRQMAMLRELAVITPVVLR